MIIQGLKFTTKLTKTTENTPGEKYVTILRTLSHTILRNLLKSTVNY